jgi:hypothetical protein
MTPAGENDPIRAWEENSLTLWEFFAHIWENLQELPLAIRHAVLEALPAHTNEVYGRRHPNAGSLRIISS